MTTLSYTQDVVEITDIIELMYKTVSWTAGAAPNLDPLRSAFREDAVLVPAPRPAVPTTISAYIDRLGALHGSGDIKTFKETAGTTIVQVFGNLAVAIGSFKTSMDGKLSRGVSGFLFIRDDDGWQALAMAWDNESPERKIPNEMI